MEFEQSLKALSQSLQNIFLHFEKFYKINVISESLF
jgi:hypothetical protein